MIPTALRDLLKEKGDDGHSQDSAHRHSGVDAGACEVPEGAQRCCFEISIRFRPQKLGEAGHVLV